MSDQPSSRESRDRAINEWEGDHSREISVAKVLPADPASSTRTVDAGFFEALRRVSQHAQEATSLETLVDSVVRIAREELPALGLDVILGQADALSVQTPDRIVVPLEVSGRVLGAVLFRSAADAPLHARALLDALTLAASGVLARTRFEHFRRIAALLVVRASIPLAVLDAEGRLEIASRPLSELLGLPVRSRSRLVDLVVPEDRKKLEDALSEARGSHATVGPLQVRVGATSRVVPLSLEMAALGGPDGSIDGVVVLGSDLSEVERLEQQVRHSDRLATLGRIAAGVVHELNNPLSSIFAHAEGLRRRAQGDGRERAELDRLERILESAERVRKLTQDLTTYARPGSGKVEELTLESVIEQSLGFCEHVLRETGVTVEKRFAPATSRVRGVRDQLQQVFINLITNASHAMVGNAARLRIETKDGARDRVEVRLSDSGPGVPVGMRESIFEPFVTTKTEGQGTGLGLSIVRSLVERHDGTVHVEGEDGEGATFVVTLPAVRPESNRPAAG